MNLNITSIKYDKLLDVQRRLLTLFSWDIKHSLLEHQIIFYQYYFSLYNSIVNESDAVKGHMNYDLFHNVCKINIHLNEIW